MPSASPANSSCNLITNITNPGDRPGSPWGNLLLGLFYFLFAQLSIELIAPDSQPSPAFFPAGFSVCAVLIFGPSAGWGVWFGATAKNLCMLVTGQADHVNAWITASTLGTTAEPLLAAYLIQRLCGPRLFPNTLAEMAAWMSAIGLACLPAAVLGGMYVTPLDADSGSLWAVATAWWQGDVVGILFGLVTLRAFGSQRSEREANLNLWLPIGLMLLAIGLEFGCSSAWLQGAGVLLAIGVVFSASYLRGCHSAAWLILLGAVVPALLLVSEALPVGDLPDAFLILNIVLLMGAAWTGRRLAGRADVLRCGWRDEIALWSKSDTFEKTLRLPALLLSLVTLAVMILNLVEYARARQLMTDLGRNLSTQLESSLRAPMTVQQHVAASWTQDAVSDSAWDRHVQLITQDCTFLQAVGYVDPAGVIRRLRPLGGNEDLLTTNLNTNPELQRTLAQAVASRSLATTPLLKLRQGGYGLISIMPLFRGDRHDGFHVIVLDLEQVFIRAMEPMQKIIQSCQIDVQMANETPISFGPAATGLANLWPSDFSVPIADSTWKVRILPSRQSLILPTWRSSTTTLLAGLIFGPVLILLRFLLFRSHETEQLLSENSRFQKTILESAGEAIIATDDGLTITLFNPEAQRLTGYSADELVGRRQVAVLHDPEELKAAIDRIRSQGLSIPHSPEGLAQGIAAGYLERDWECHLLTKGHDRIPVLMSLTPLRDPQGQVEGFLGVARDISTRKRTEAAIAAGHKRFAAIFEHSPTPIFIARIEDNRILHVNRSWQQLFGFTAAEAVHCTCQDLHLWTDPGQRESLYAQLQQFGQVTHFEARISTKADGDHDVVIHASQADLDGTPCIIAQLIDLTEKNELELAARESNERFGQIAKHIPEVFWMFDNQRQQFVYASPAFESIFGRPVTKLYADRGFTLSCIHPDDQAVMVDAMRRQERGEPTEMEYRIIRPDGTVRWIAEHSVPILDDHGRLNRTTGIATDITDRVQSEGQAREALATLDATKDAALIFEPDSFRISHANQGAAEMLDRTKMELLELSLTDICPQYDRQGFATLLEPLKERLGSVVNMQLELCRNDGSKVITETSLQFVRLPGRRSRFIALARDISERLAKEAQDRRTQRLDSIGTLAGGIAHDLNNSLSPVVMGMQVLRDTFPQESRLLDTVESSARHAAEMVRQLLNFARGAEGEHELLQPQLLLNEIKNIVSRTFPKNIDFSINYGGDLPYIKGDLTQLHQVILNLCVNARDAMPEGGRLEISVDKLALEKSTAASLGGSDARPGTYVRLSVTDSGTGMSAAVMEHIFDPFFTTKTMNEGTGLGLSSVVGIVKGHHGFVRVTSKPGSGSCFEVYLPASATTLIAGPGIPTETPQRGNGELVLLVDDEQQIRNMGILVLERLGYSVITAENGAEGLEKMAGQATKAVGLIVDMHMPVMDGLTMITELRISRPDLPIIAASGRFDDVTRNRLKKLHVAATLPKPFTQDQLAAAMSAFHP